MTPKVLSFSKRSSKKYDIEKLHADKAPDNRRNFNLLDELDVEPAIDFVINVIIPIIIVVVVAWAGN